MATATLITIPVYKINSNQLIDRTQYLYGMPMAFAGASVVAQPNSGTTVHALRAGTALVYSKVMSSATGTTVFYSNLTVAAIVALANA